MFIEHGEGRLGIDHGGSGEGQAISILYHRGGDAGHQGQVTLFQLTFFGGLQLGEVGGQGLTSFHY